MRRADLEHIITAACTVAKQDQVLVIGSQSILATYSEYELPAESTYSEEADVFPLFDDRDGTQSTLIDGSIGEMSQFHQQFGYYAQGVDRRTATIPKGWADRLVPIRNENTRYFTGWCLEVHDLCSAKLIANREKDRGFVAALIREDLVSVATLKARIEATSTADSSKAIARGWLAMWDEDQPAYKAPDAPIVPADWPDHPATVLSQAEPEGQGPSWPPGSWPHAQGGLEPGHAS